MEIKDPLYSLELSGDWTELPSSDPEQHTVRSQAADVTIVMSSMSLDVPPDQTDLLARKMIEFRLKGEEQAAREHGVQMTIAEPIVVERPWGHAIAYYGSDSKGRQFNFSGMITRKGVISLYADSKSKDEKELSAAVQPIFGKVEFDRTPVAPAH